MNQPPPLKTTKTYIALQTARKEPKGESLEQNTYSDKVHTGYEMQR